MKYTNFQDIPERMKSYYCIDVDFRNLEKTIDRFVDRYNLELNPDFQRGHVWTEEQQISYVEYLLTQPDKDSTCTIIFNCPGWMNTKKWRDEMVCVDGLQRLTACLRFLRNEIPAYGTLYKDYSGYMKGGLKVHIGAFETKKEVLQWYLELNAKGTPHTDEEIERVTQMLEQET